jgi:D-3-phosphoglycerate dehydrogenase
MGNHIFRIQKLNNIAEAGLERFPRRSYEIASEFQRADAILVRSYRMHDMDIPDSVLAVGRAGAGVNNIPVADMTKRGIPVFNAPGANANAVKELVLAGMLLAARNLIAASDYVRGLNVPESELADAMEAGKKQFVGFELPRKTLGVIGLGSVGVHVANAALDLGMDVIGFDPNITVQSAWQLSAGVRKAISIDDLFSRADIVTVHVPSNESTRGMVNAARLELMPVGAVVLNFSRADVAQVNAVLDGLNSGRLAAYVTDFPEPSLVHHPKAICFPHLGASTTEAEENCAVMVANQLREFLENGNVSHSVNFPETVLQRTRPHRLAIPHANVPNMVAQILSALGGENINIADLLNRSRDTISYTIVDLDAPVSADTVANIKAINGILSVRVLPIIDD